jgi:hypothetical protein
MAEGRAPHLVGIQFGPSYRCTWSGLMRVPLLRFSPIDSLYEEVHTHIVIQ